MMQHRLPESYCRLWSTEMRAEFSPTDQPRAHWISARLRFAILIEGAGLLGFEDRVYLFQHSDLDTALNQAAEIGKNHNHECVNAEGQKVRWLPLAAWPPRASGIMSPPGRCFVL